MSTINLSLPDGVSISDGKQITFKAPCNCSDVTGVIIEGVTYTLVDATNTSLSEYSNSFKEGALISVIIDTTSNKAYILNSGSVQRSTDGSIDMDSKSIKNLADPVNDTDAVNKKYVDDSSGYKLGDILTTVRTDLDETWALCNGDYIDESQPIYNILPDISYESEEAWEIYDELSMPCGFDNTTTVINISRCVGGYYIVHGTYTNNSSTQHCYAIMSDLYGSNMVSIDSDAANLVLYNGMYLYVSSKSIHLLDVSTGSSTTYLSSAINNNYGSSLQSFQNNLLVLSSTYINNNTLLSCEYNDSNNILYTNSPVYIANDNMYTITYSHSSSAFILNIYKYNSKDNFISVGDVSIPYTSSSTLTNLGTSKLSLYYSNGAYYMLLNISKNIYIIKSIDGNNWTYSESIDTSSYANCGILGILNNNIVLCYITSSISNIYATIMISLSDTSDTRILPYSCNSKIVYDNHYVILSSITRVTSVVNNYNLIRTYNSGRMLPKISSSTLTYSYIKVGGNL